MKAKKEKVVHSTLPWEVIKRKYFLMSQDINIDNDIIRTLNQELVELKHALNH